MKHRIAIFGGGRVGTAMSLEMPSVPIVRRGYDCRCDIACVCWPAQAMKDFSATHPQGSNGTVIAFCNGAWAKEDGAQHAGICYVRAANRGDRAPAGRKAWRVGCPACAAELRASGLGVVLSRRDHEGYVWEKALYILPLALACEDTAGMTAREVVHTLTYMEWYNVIRNVAVKDIGEEIVERHEARVKFLTMRSPAKWRPSSSPEELAYFRERLCAV